MASPKHCQRTPLNLFGGLSVWRRYALNRLTLSSTLLFTFLTGFLVVLMRLDYLQALFSGKRECWKLPE